MKEPDINWPEAVKPLLKKYKNKPHPLEAESLYQFLVMVVLSAQSTDNIINQIAPELFKAFPNMNALASASVETLTPFISKVRGFRKKANWLIGIAKELKNDSNIPLNMQQLTDLSGIGRKSANVILRYAKARPEGIIVDLHVVRVAPRLGIATGDDPTKIEKQIMDVLPQKQWDAGMAMSFLGREICRPEPACDECLMKKVCAYYNGWL
ncbi:endonuclease III [Hanamia caeni]|jgi:endonuclease-3|uniref:Endonuclease III n=1 Tax=Hanamia caeni TaxID=2294116 RepID=A0A3M9NRD7_9BACT|nr:endonuclease III [Hanamia caeni]RNI39867.1 endonuclease III [Hanamia caeni]